MVEWFNDFLQYSANQQSLPCLQELISEALRWRPLPSGLWHSVTIGRYHASGYQGSDNHCLKSMDQQPSVCLGHHIANRSLFITALLILWALWLSWDPMKPLEDMGVRWVRERTKKISSQQITNKYQLIPPEETRTHKSVQICTFGQKKATDEKKSTGSMGQETERCNWTDADESCLVNYICYYPSRKRGQWTQTFWAQAAINVVHTTIGGAVKMSHACHQKWQRIANFSGILWNNEHRANITSESESVWADLIKEVLLAKPFKKKGQW
ncbi:hypothetical protein EDB19DRAFT_1827054 [Suillus lakei]|nr:hypothetical protein EDB19DRAFT_1827054 [Suillus lakei]